MLGGDKMASVKITQVEADRLLKMLKRTLISEISFPAKGESVEFNVAGDSKQDIFAINIFRGKIYVRRKMQYKNSHISSI